MTLTLTSRAPLLRPTWNAATTGDSDTNAWYWGDYAGQDPINAYDLAGTDVCRHLGWLLDKVCSGTADAGKAVVNGVKAYGAGSLNATVCIYQCIGVVGYHGSIYLQTGDSGSAGKHGVGGSLTWSKQGPYSHSDDLGACAGVCVSRSVERGTGNQSYAFGIGTAGVNGGHSHTVKVFTLPWSGY